jgi:hypothetical protein
LGGEREKRFEQWTKATGMPDRQKIDAVVILLMYSFG